MHKEWTTLHQDIEAFLHETPLYYSHAGEWHPCTWSTPSLSPHLRLDILLGGPLHKSKWGCAASPIKTWHQTFLNYAIPRVWTLLQDKARRGRRMPSG